MPFINYFVSDTMDLTDEDTSEQASRIFYISGERLNYIVTLSGLTG